VAKDSVTEEIGNEVGEGDSAVDVTEATDEDKVPVIDVAGDVPESVFENDVVAITVDEMDTDEEGLDSVEDDRLSIEVDDLTTLVVSVIGETVGAVNEEISKDVEPDCVKDRVSVIKLMDDAVELIDSD
jgi:hypothetical protein